MSSRDAVQEILKHGDITINGERRWDLHVHNDRFYVRLLRDGSLGLGESYMLGWWDCDDLFTFFKKILSSQRTLRHKNVGWRTRLAFVKARLTNVQHIGQTRELADTHYNLSNELFEHMLGTSMAYSCGYWANADNLDQAQFAKYERISRKLKLEPGDRVLEIGCGWGGLAKYMATHHHCEVVGITIAEEQADYARTLCDDLPVTIAIKDYREFEADQFGGPFDKVVSVGMIEHVGYRNYRALFEAVERALRPRGLFLAHTIASTVSMEIGDPWLGTYIFPGGMLPSMHQLSDAAEGLFILHDVENIGVNYTPTLLAWHDNFVAYWSAAERVKARPRIWGSEETFFRMWRYYLMCCAAEFEAGDSQVWQITYSKGHLPNGYRRDVT